MALVYHYMYLLGSIQKQQYPPRMTYQLRQAVKRFEEIKAQFDFLREHNIETQADMDACVVECKAKLEPLTKQRTILNTRKKKRRELFNALTTEEQLRLPAEMHSKGDANFGAEAREYAEAVRLLDSCGISREELLKEKIDLYSQIAEVNFQIRQLRKDLKMCDKIINRVPIMERRMKEAGQIKTTGKKRKQEMER